MTGLRFRPGDWAVHVDGDLDPRRVVRTGRDASGKEWVTLEFFGRESGKFSADQYTKAPRKAR